MLYPRLKIELFEHINEQTSIVGSDITDMVTSDASAGIETTKDIFTVKLINHRNSIGGRTVFLGKSEDVNNRFRINDDFKIYGWYGAQPTKLDDALLLYGTLNSYDYNVNESNFSVVLRGANRTEEMLNTFTPFSSYVGVGTITTPPKIIKQMIKRLRQTNTKHVLYADLDDDINPESSLVFKYTGSVGGLHAFKSGAYDSLGSLQSGSESYTFPEINYNETWKPIYFNVEKLSLPKYTDDTSVGTYMFYIRTLEVLKEYRAEAGSVINDLVWKPLSVNTTGSVNEGTDMFAYGLGFDKEGIINTLIADCGTDLEGHGILGIAYNLDSIGKNGVKTDYYSESRRVFSSLHKEEINVGSTAGSTIDENGYPNSFGAGWTMLFGTRDDTGSPIGNPIDVTSKKEFNSELRNEARWVGVKEAQAIVDVLGKIRLRLSYELENGSNNFSPGDLREYVATTLGWDGTSTNQSKLLRIRDWTHTMDANGWNTKIIAKEDEEVVSTLLGND